MSSLRPFYPNLMRPTYQYESPNWAINGASKGAPWKNSFFITFWPLDPWIWHLSYEQGKNFISILWYSFEWFSQKTPQKCRLFFKWKWGGLKYFFFKWKWGGLEYLFQFFLSILDRSKPNQNQLNLRNLPPLTTPYPSSSWWLTKSQRE